MTQTSDFYTCPVNRQNIQYLPALINGQALHHNSNFIGKLSNLRRDFITAAQPTANIELIYHKKMGLIPIGYIAYNEMVTEKGLGLYLEDIYIEDQVRAKIKGAGSYGFYKLIDTAIKGKMPYIQWAVAQNNEASTFGFYENKIGGVPLDKTLYDLDDILVNGVFYNQDLENKSLHVTRADKTDLLAIRVAVDNYNKQARHPATSNIDDLMDHIEQAIDHHNSSVYICKSVQDGIVGLTFCNTNYSTFRTVKGLKAEPMIALTENSKLYQQSLYLTAVELTKYANATSHTGHFIWAVNSQDALAHRFMTSQDAHILQMEADNMASTLVMYGIKDHDISLKKRNSLIPKKP